VYSQVSTNSKKKLKKTQKNAKKTQKIADLIAIVS